MSPSHSNKGGKRYRYYISQALLQNRKNEAGAISKIPAGEIESLVKSETKSFIFNVKNIQQYIDSYDIQKQKDLLCRLKELDTDFKSRPDNVFIRTVLNKVILYKEKVAIILCKDQLLKVLKAITYDIPYPEELKEESKEPILITCSIRISSTSKNGSILIISDSEKQEINHSAQLIEALAKSYYWNELMITGEIKSSTDILKIENKFGKSYINYILGLRFLAPDIVETILNGKQPRDLTLQKLFQIKTSDWDEQRKLLNF